MTTSTALHLLPDEFWTKVSKTETCWLWTAPLNDGGYGQIYLEGKRPRVHRLAYEALVGPIPDGMQLDHLCRVRNCINPLHLEPVPQRVNILRGESPSARNARATHCKHGHEFTRENTYHRPDRPWQRHCRQCIKVRNDARSNGSSCDALS